MKKWSVQSLFIIIIFIVLTGCGSKFETVSEYNERLEKESEERQKVLETMNTPDSASADAVQSATPKKQSKLNAGAKKGTKPFQTTEPKTSNVRKQKETPKNFIKKENMSDSASKAKKINNNKSGKTKKSKIKKQETKKPGITKLETTKPETTKPTATKPTATEQPQPEYIIVYLTISCIDVLSHPNYSNDNSLPTNGFILSKERMPIKKGENVLAVVQAACSDKNIQFSYTGSAKNATAYINSIYNIKEKKYGRYSGWMYKVGGTSQGAGISTYIPKDSDQIELYYVTS